MKFLSLALTKTAVAICLLGSFFPMDLRADQESMTELSPAIFASIWQAPKLYKNKDNPTIQSFSVVGRYH